jgi:hypothetical protein
MQKVELAKTTRMRIGRVRRTSVRGMSMLLCVVTLRLLVHIRTIKRIVFSCSSPQSPPLLPPPGQPLKLKFVLQLKTNIPHEAIHIHLSPVPNNNDKYKPPVPPTL